MLTINIIGFLLIVFIVWWFWLFKPKGDKNRAEPQIIIVENGGYSPAIINLISGQESMISFLRKDLTPCSGTLVFTGLDINEELAVGKIKTIRLPKLKPGSYVFGCQMQMYRGELHVI